MNLTEYYTPEYLFCEQMPKDGTAQDQRVWIYSPKSLSLIEFVCMTDIVVPNFDESRKAGEFFHQEDFHAYWIQNNCEFTNQDQAIILEGAWRYLLNYMKWEDQQIKGEGKFKLK